MDSSEFLRHARAIVSGASISDGHQRGRARYVLEEAEYELSRSRGGIASSEISLSPNISWGGAHPTRLIHARAQWLRGDREAAQRTVREVVGDLAAVARYSNQPLALARLSVIQFRMGNEEATRTWTTAIQKFNSCPPGPI